MGQGKRRCTQAFERSHGRSDPSPALLLEPVRSGNARCGRTDAQ